MALLRLRPRRPPDLRKTERLPYGEHLTITSRIIRHCTARWRKLVDRRRDQKEQKVWHLYDSVRVGQEEKCQRLCGAPAFELVSIDGVLVCGHCLRILLKG